MEEAKQKQGGVEDPGWMETGGKREVERKERRDDNPTDERWLLCRRDPAEKRQSDGTEEDEKRRMWSVK